MFSDPDYLLLYDKNKSYLWKYRREIIDSIQQLSTKHLDQVPAKSIDAFKEYVKIRMQAAGNPVKESKEEDKQAEAKKEADNPDDANYKPLNVYHDYGEEDEY